VADFSPSALCIALACLPFAICHLPLQKPPPCWNPRWAERSHLCPFWHPLVVSMVRMWFGLRSWRSAMLPSTSRMQALHGRRPAPAAPVAELLTRWSFPQPSGASQPTANPAAHFHSHCCHLRQFSRIDTGKMG